MQESPTYKTITRLSELEETLASVSFDSVIAVDTETSGLDPNQPSLRLLGVSVSTEHLVGCRAFYVPLEHYNIATRSFYEASEPGVREFLTEFLSKCTNAVGHNYIFDSRWLQAKLDIDMAFTYDTQIMWHLSSAPFNKQSYGLKRAQTDLLGWPARGDIELKEQIETRSKELGEWGFYLADLEVLGKYAAMDAYATLLLFKQLSDFFNTHDYWAFATAMQQYRELLQWNTDSGIPVDMEKLEKYRESLVEEEIKIKDFLQLECAEAIREIENEMLEAQVNGLKKPESKAKLLSETHRHPKFNFSSDPQLANLLYDKFKFPVTERTPKGKPKTNKLALQQIQHPVAKSLARLSRVEKLVTSFIDPYLTAAKADSKLHPAFNITGTVSGRLSGYSPNVQQMPFKENGLMECFSIPNGQIAVHMDLVSIEPFFTAFFSRDPILLKVYRDHAGDIYLDLALKLFPENVELQAEYKFLEKPSTEIKNKFKKERDVSKLVHLACQYGGGAGTISKNLTLAGFPTNLSKARNIVKAYWEAFQQVKNFERLLYNIYKEDGKLVNPFGRIVRLPDFYCKDLLNRFIQGTASDCLKTIVMEIARTNGQEKLGMVPLLIDVHDATTWRVPKDNAERAKAVLLSAVDTVSERLGLDFPIRADAKFLENLSDIKND
jgi:DNA polymerase I-like protein with 3'-5' exonuclease and polymerase domains